MVFNQPLTLHVGEDNNVTFLNCKFNRSISIYNGMDLSKHHSLHPENMELQNSRISLLDKLRNLRDKCININLSKTVEDTVVVKTKTK